MHILKKVVCFGSTCVIVYQLVSGQIQLLARSMLTHNHSRTSKELMKTIIIAPKKVVLSKPQIIKICRV